MGAVICSRWMRDWSAQCPYCRHLGEKHPPHGRTRDCEECRRAVVATIIVTPVGTGATRQPSRGRSRASRLGWDMNCPNCGCDASAVILWPDDGTDGRRYWHPDSTACDVYMWDSDGYVLGAREAPARRPQR